MMQDVRWKQRFDNYQKALAQLTLFIQAGELNFLEDQGLIQAFEYTYELAWNVLRDFLKESANPAPMHGAKDTFRIGFKEGLLSNGTLWMEMIEDRNMTVHSYNEATAQKITANIRQLYYPQFLALAEKLQQFYA